jgi:hypothetical protein
MSPRSTWRAPNEVSFVSSPGRLRELFLEVITPISYPSANLQGGAGLLVHSRLPLKGATRNTLPTACFEVIEPVNGEKPKPFTHESTNLKLSETVFLGALAVLLVILPAWHIVGWKAREKRQSAYSW